MRYVVYGCLLFLHSMFVYSLDPKHQGRGHLEAWLVGSCADLFLAMLKLGPVLRQVSVPPTQL